MGETRLGQARSSAESRSLRSSSARASALDASRVTRAVSASWARVRFVSDQADTRR